jgi:hypothetical protein
MRVVTFAALLQDDNLELHPGFITEGEPSHEQSGLTVEALGRGRRPLATTMVPLHKSCGGSGGETLPAAFGLVAFPEKAIGLRVSLDGKVLLEQTASRDHLEVNVEWPGSLAGAEVIRWHASADVCFASLGYSNDGGKTWTPLALPGPSNTIEVNAEALPGGRDCFLELIVTDGFRTRRIRSGAYEVEPKGWVLWILSPAAGAKPPSGQPVLLAAQGYHLEERRASFDNIEWESSAGGGLGTGARVLAVLDPGEQIITASMYGVTAHVAVSVVRQSGNLSA